MHDAPIHSIQGAAVCTMYCVIDSAYMQLHSARQVEEGGHHLHELGHGMKVYSALTICNCIRKRSRNGCGLF